VDYRPTNIASVWGNGTLLKYDPNTSSITTIASGLVDVDNANTADSPSAVTLDSAGNVYILTRGSKASGSGTIRKYSADGAFIEKFRSTDSSQPTALKQPVSGIQVTSDYRIYVSDTANNRIVYYTQTIDAPTNPVASSTDGTVSLSWSHIADTRLTSYTIRRSMVDYPATVTDGVAVTSNVASNVGSYDDLGLNSGTYYYSLFSLDTLGNSSAAAQASVTVTNVGPDAPTSLSANVSGATAQLNWINPTLDFSSITIRRSTIAYPSTVNEGSMVVSNLINTSYNDAGLADGTYYYSVFALDAQGNSSTAAQTSVTIDVTEPVVLSATPSDDAIGVAVGANLVLTFSEPVNVGTGNILIKKTRNDATVATIDVTSDQVTGSGTTDITLNPTNDLDALVGYYVVISTTAFTDLFGNAYSGLATSTDLNFITQGTAGVTVTPATLSLTEGSIIDRFHVSLSTEPTADVTIHFETLTGASAFDQLYLTFTPDNWSTAQSVFVNAVDDQIDQGRHADTLTFSSASSDTNYNALAISTITANILDNDRAGITMGTISGNTTEAGGQATFTVVLNSKPTATVQIPVSSSNSAEGTTNVSLLTFTPENWNVAQTITLTGQNDTSDDSDITYTISVGAAVSSDTNYSGLDATDVTVINTDDDAAPVEVIQKPSDVVAQQDIKIKGNSKQPVISWTEITNATFYTFKLTGKKGRVLLLVNNLTTPKYVVTPKWYHKHIHKHKRYKVYVQACNTAGCSDWSKAKVWSSKLK